MLIGMELMVTIINVIIISASQSWFSCRKWVVIRTKLPLAANVPTFPSFQHSNIHDGVDEENVYILYERLWMKIGTDDTFFGCRHIFLARWRLFGQFISPWVKSYFPFSPLDTRVKHLGKKIRKDFCSLWASAPFSWPVPETAAPSLSICNKRKTSVWRMEDMGDMVSPRSVQKWNNQYQKVWAYSFEEFLKMIFSSQLPNCTNYVVSI